MQQEDRQVLGPETRGSIGAEQPYTCLGTTSIK
jgi:hypothetical protein